MSSLPPNKPAEFTASDILSADAWTGRAPRPVLGLDVACTKIAVDFQNMRKDQIDDTIQRNLELLREATATDCAFLATFRPDELVVEDVQLARSAFAQSRPEGLRELSIENFPWLKSRLDHLRLSELRDTSTPRREQTVEAQKFADPQSRYGLVVALRVSRRA